MDASWLILVLSGLVIGSYVLDLLGKLLHIPSVVLLLAVGIGLRLFLDKAGIAIEFVDVILPTLGTLGLILIVLEGALDLTLARDKLGTISKALSSAILGLGITAGLMACCFVYLLHLDWLKAWIYATPLAVISSAVAIPAAASLAARQKEFVVYESSLSDILGVMLFYTLLENKGGLGSTTISAASQIGISIVVGLFFAVGLYWLISRATHHVRFLPMIFGLSFLYAAGKLLHLAPLVMILVVGLFLNNHGLLKRVPLWHKIYDHWFDEELDSFKHLTAEFTFVVRAFFFILLGYSTPLAQFGDIYAWGVALLVLACIFIPRLITTKALFGKFTSTEFWFAPRGLITVLLFLSLPSTLHIEKISSAALMLVVLLSTLIMAGGNLYSRRRDEHERQRLQQHSTPSRQSDSAASAVESPLPGVEQNPMPTDDKT